MANAMEEMPAAPAKNSEDGAAAASELSFTGGMEKLGIMPVLLALYLQFKDWRLGDWSVLSKITVVQSVLAFLLLFAYALSWHLIRLRVRVQTYEQLLGEANRQDTAASG